MCKICHIRSLACAAFKAAPRQKEEESHHVRAGWLAPALTGRADRVTCLPARVPCVQSGPAFARQVLNVHSALLSVCLWSRGMTLCQEILQAVAVCLCPGLLAARDGHL